MSRPLPSIDDDAATPETTKAPPPPAVSDLSEPVPARSTNHLGDKFAYLIHVSQRGQGLGCVTVLVHAKRFTKREIDDMVAEAARITDQSSVGGRRKAMAAARTPVDPELNERVFPSDVEFFEGVMMDKWQFQRLNTFNATASIDPTAKAARSPA